MLEGVGDSLEIHFRRNHRFQCTGIYGFPALSTYPLGEGGGGLLPRDEK